MGLLREQAHFVCAKVTAPLELWLSCELDCGLLGPYFLSKLAAELPVTAIFPVLFGAIMYPLAGLQPSAKKFFTFLGTTPSTPHV